MARNIFLGSITVCVLLIGLSQVPDPGIFGIQEEPERVMYYGGSGLLAGISGLIALVSGAYFGASRVENLSAFQRRFILVIMAILLIAVITAIVFRLSPM